MGWLSDRLGIKWDPIKDIGNAWDKARGTVERSIGLKPEDIPADKQIQIDPQKAHALSQYGQQTQQFAGGFDSSKYGASYNQPLFFNPQISSNTVGMPGQQIPEHLDISRQREGKDATLEKYLQPQQQSQQFNTPYEQQTNEPVQQQVGGVTPQVQQVNPNVSLGRESVYAAPHAPNLTNRTLPTTNEANRQIGQRTPESMVQQPQMQTEQGQGVNFQSVAGVSPDNSRYQQALNLELERAQNPLQLDAGFNPEMRQKAIQLATSGIDMAKERAMEQLKEQQMKAGNFGSSVGQREMAELAMQYDMQRANAEANIDVQHMMAERDDRYRNVDAEMKRSGLTSGLAGQGQGMTMEEARMQIDKIGIDNAANQIAAQFSREGRQMDNATAMKLAEFARQGRQQDFNNLLAEAGFSREGTMLDQGTQERKATFDQNAQQQTFLNQLSQYQQEQQARGIDRSSDMWQAEFNRASTMDNNQLAMALEQMRQQGIQIDNDTAMRLADYLRGGRQLDIGRDERSQERDDRRYDVGFNQAMGLAEYDRRGRDIDYQRDLLEDQTNYARQQDARQEDWSRYLAGQDESRYRDALVNQGNLFNIGQHEKSRDAEYQRYLDAMRGLSGYAGDTIDLESLLRNKQYMDSKGQAQDKFNAFTGAIGNIGGRAIDKLLDKYLGK